MSRVGHAKQIRLARASFTLALGVSRGCDCYHMVAEGLPESDPTLRTPKLVSIVR